MWYALLALWSCTGDKSPATSNPDDSGTASAWDCVIPEGTTPDWSDQLGCRADFDALAADPLDASIPGAQSSKTVIDRVDGDALYFTNSELYPLHYDFASAFLSGDGLPIVGSQGDFNDSEYYAPDRRFILGAVTWYEDPQRWVYEIAPYDTADAEMIETAFDLIRDNAYFGDEMDFHPTSEAIAAVAEDLPDDVPILTTDELYEGITYQPLNLGTAVGQLQFRTAEEAEDYVNYREIAVLEEIPNDISVVAATITGEFQTPLAHINILAQNRGTPNMALKGAYDDPTLRALEGKWVKLTVDALDWTIEEVSQEEADAWWEEHRPEPLDVTPMDLSVTDLRDCEQILDLDTYDLGDALHAAIPAFGGKATNMGGMVLIGQDTVPTPDCFSIPVYYYNQHMEDNGLWDEYAEMSIDPDFTGDPETRADMLATLQEDIEDAPIDPDFLEDLLTKIDADYGHVKMRFRSSTNGEDLGNFTGAGLYDSESGDWDDAGEDIAKAIKHVWASTWGPRAWEEREYWSMDHTQIGMALLVHPTFDQEDAGGVAVTGNVYDTTGLEPGFYVNTQIGENSVVAPEPGVTTDQFIYYYDMPGQPVVYIAHSNLIQEGTTVLTDDEIHTLGVALDAIHSYFYPAYGMSGGWYAMDTEFKFTDGQLVVKQARPYPGWSAE